MIMDLYQSCSLTPTPMIRYTAPPTKYDTASYGTVCALHLNDEGTARRFYIQIAEDESNPHWIPVEELVVMAFKPLFENPCFIQDCLSKVKTQL